MAPPSPSNGLRAWAGDVMVRSIDWMDEHRRRVASGALLTVAVCTGLLLHLNGLPGYTRCKSLSEAAVWLAQRQRRSPLRRALLPGSDQLRLPVRVESVGLQGGGVVSIHAVHYPLLLRLRHLYSGTAACSFTHQAAAAGEALPVHLLGVVGCSNAGVHLLQQHLPGTMARLHITCVTQVPALEQASPPPAAGPPPPQAATSSHCRSTAETDVGHPTCLAARTQEHAAAASLSAEAAAAVAATAGPEYQLSSDRAQQVSQQHQGSSSRQPPPANLCEKARMPAIAITTTSSTTTSSSNSNGSEYFADQQGQQVAWGMLYMQRCSRTQLRQSRAAAASEAAAAAVQGHHVIGTPTMFSRLAAAQQWVSSRLSWRSSNHGSTSSSSSDDCSSRTGGMVTAAAAADASSIPEPLTATTTTNSSSKGGDSGGEAGRPQHSLPCAVWAAVAPHVDAAQLLLVQGLAQAMAPEDCEWLGLPANTLLQYERAQGMSRRKRRGVWQSC